jgi:hypothetical protein
MRAGAATGACGTASAEADATHEALEPEGDILNDPHDLGPALPCKENILDDLSTVIREMSSFIDLHGVTGDVEMDADNVEVIADNGGMTRLVLEDPQDLIGLWIYLVEYGEDHLDAEEPMRTRTLQFAGVPGAFAPLEGEHPVARTRRILAFTQGAADHVRQNAGDHREEVAIGGRACRLHSIDANLRSRGRFSHVAMLHHPWCDVPALLTLGDREEVAVEGRIPRLLQISRDWDENQAGSVTYSIAGCLHAENAGNASAMDILRAHGEMQELGLTPVDGGCDA